MLRSRSALRRPRATAITLGVAAATPWYHPHPHGATEKQVTMGLAGMFILDDDTEAALPLPRDYGVDDIPLIVQDACFTGEGQLTTTTRGFIGPIGDLIGTDGGLLEVPYATDHIQLPPGERAEVLVRMGSGDSVTLRSTPPDLGIEAVPSGMNAGNDPDSKDPDYTDPDYTDPDYTNPDYTNPDFSYMYHCHLLWHEDRGMMGQFVVVKPGQRAGTPPTAHDQGIHDRSFTEGTTHVRH